MKPTLKAWPRSYRSHTVPEDKTVPFPPIRNRRRLRPCLKVFHRLPWSC